VAITLCGPAFQQVHLASGLVTLLTRSCNPTVQARWFRLFRFRSPLLSESRLIYFPPGTEMVHFPGLARTRLCIQRVVARFCRAGFPHSDIPGSKPVCGFPRLIAAYHVLRRLLAPRHPPYALSSLTIKLTQHVGLRQARFEPCLKPSTKCPRGSLPSKRVQRQVRLSTIRYSRAKICSLLRYANLDIRATQCQLPSVVKEHWPDHRFPIGTSPLPAERGIGLEPRPRKIKNP